MPPYQIALNYIDNQWRQADTDYFYTVLNPATIEELGKTPYSRYSDVNLAAEIASKAQLNWQWVPVRERVEYLFTLKNLLNNNIDDLCQTITLECGKTLNESREELVSAIKNIEIACEMTSLIQGQNNLNFEYLTRSPLGVIALIVPFNAPVLIPFWFLPYAIACGNTVILKPSEKTPMTMQKVFHLIEQTNLPSGVINLVNGADEVVDALLDHPAVRAISFVGSSQVAEYIYQRAATNGKRVQCFGSVKNPAVILPDADLDFAAKAIAANAFCCAGQSSDIISLAITVGSAHKPFTTAVSEYTHNLKVGFGLDAGVQMGPVINARRKTAIEETIENAIRENATLLMDGRKPTISGYENGYFLLPTIIEAKSPANKMIDTEIFGPVLTVMNVNTIEEALQVMNASKYGNIACIFTKSGASAQQFRLEVNASTIGINLETAAPTPPYPCGGRKASFYGDLNAQGMDAIEFFTQKKVILERWAP